jgi:Predicted integral membrane protein (DUF2269)
VRWWVLLHVATAFWFVAGLAGRDVLMTRARSAGDLATMRTLTDAAGVFDRSFVIPGSIAVLVAGLVAVAATHRSLGEETWLLVSLLLFLSIIPLVPLVFVPRGKVFEAARADAESQGRITPALEASLNDRAVWGARWYERIVVAVVIVLMVTKPF